MVQDRLKKTVLRRFKELGLPPSLIDLSEFHDHFFKDQWVMFVRDGDKSANVHLIEPRPESKSSMRGCGSPRSARNQI